jgi:hypothetical protein
MTDRQRLGHPRRRLQLLLLHRLLHGLRLLPRTLRLLLLLLLIWRRLLRLL